MTGFVDLDCALSKSDLPATHALQFYIRSFLHRFSRPLAFFPTCNVKAYELTALFWKAVSALDECGFTVLALVGDGAACNRKLFQLLNNLNLDVPYKCQNIYNPDMHIFLISDPPHLLKTACNNVRSSKTDGSKCLRFGEHLILWKHFCQVPHLYQTNELRSCKLHCGHFCNQSYAKMKVLYAAQLLSDTVANLMEARGGEEMKKSAWFARLMNKWFDLMNTSNNAGYHCDRPLMILDLNGS